MFLTIFRGVRGTVVQEVVKSASGVVIKVVLNVEGLRVCRFRETERRDNYRYRFRACSVKAILMKGQSRG